MEKQEVSISLTVEDVNTLLTILNETSMPFKVSAPLIQKLRTQAEAQLAPAPTGVEGTDAE